MVTITSSVGFEAILLKKPTVVFGNVFYDCYSKAVKVNSSPEKWSEAIRIAENLSITDKDPLVFLTAYLHSLHAFPVSNYFHPEFFSARNMRAVASSLKGLLSRK